MKIRLSRYFSILFFTTIYLVWALSPTLKETLNGAYSGIIALLILFLTLLTGFWKSLDNAEKSLLFVMAVYMLFQVAYIIIGYSNISLSYLQNNGLFFFAFIIGLFIKKMCTEKEKDYIITLIAVLFAVNSIVRVIPELFDVRISLFNTAFDGGTNYGHAVFLFAMLSFIMFLFSKGFHSFVWLFCSAVSILYNIFVITRGTTFILGMVSFVLFVLLYDGEKSTKKKLAIIFSILLAVVLFGQSIADKILTMKDGKLLKKLDSVEAVLNGTANTSEPSTSLSERIFLIGVDFKTWLSSPITFLMGVGNDQGFYQVSGIGWHSDIFDILPKYGVIGFTMYSFIHVGYFRYLNREAGSKIIVNIFIFVIIFLMVINYLSHVAIGPSFYILPLLLFDPIRMPKNSILAVKNH